jgi:hypothetical protein
MMMMALSTIMSSTTLQGRPRQRLVDKKGAIPLSGDPSRKSLHLRWNTIKDPPIAMLRITVLVLVAGEMTTGGTTMEIARLPPGRSSSSLPQITKNTSVVVVEVLRLGGIIRPPAVPVRTLRTTTTMLTTALTMQPPFLPFLRKTATNTHNDPPPTVPLPSRRL